MHRFTGDPAAFYGLGDRGVLTPGRRADINLIDLDNLGLRYPERVEDLPAGAGRLIQRSDGYVETLVLGETIVDEGELTDDLPGGLVKGARSAAAVVNRGAVPAGAAREGWSWCWLQRGVSGR